MVVISVMCLLLSQAINLRRPNFRSLVNTIFRPTTLASGCKIIFFLFSHHHQSIILPIFLLWCPHTPQAATTRNQEPAPALLFAILSLMLLFRASRQINSRYCTLNNLRMFSFINTIPAEIGDKLSSVDTPALIVSRKALHRNLQRMKDFVDEHNKKGPNISYRPHTKTHKCPSLAKLQVEEYGAQGVCVQVLDEVEAMLNAGVLDLFLSNQIVGAKKISRLCELSKRGKVSIIVDDMGNLQEIAAAAVASGASLDVLVEVNAGQNRCGIDVLQDNGAFCVELAKTIVACPQLTFKGVHCYHGFIQHTRSAEERRQQVQDFPVARAEIAVRALNASGIAVEVVTGGGTGTFSFESASGRYTEIQPGSYCLMDVDYGANQDGMSWFENALFLHTTVISKTSCSGVPTRAVLDAGTKASSYDSGLPVALKRESWVDGSAGQRLRKEAGWAELTHGGDEHIVLTGHYADELTVGQTLRLIPGHVDPTVNMHQYLVIVDDDTTAKEEERAGEPVVVDIWSISGRSPGL
jgi:D-serine deaminase-like pyridoxal phosphate-dependent protein